ncbi:MAG: hypothetical protein ACI8RZ_003677 [Myxococcota bacterium]|jgi:hypothetical protein
MGEMIQKPDTNPIVPAFLNWFLLGGVGYYVIGQQKKAMIATAVTVVGMCVGIGFLIPWITAYDAYLLGQKLQSGQSIGENENGLPFLNSIFKD